MAQAAIVGISLLVQGGIALASASQEADAARAQGEYEKRIADYNAKVAEEQAKDALKLGEKDVHAVNRQVDQTVGAQRVAFAAQGVDPNFGSAADVQRDARIAGSMDVMTIRNNAARQAWGYRVQAQDATMRGQFAKMAAENKASATMTTGGLKALGNVVEAGVAFAGGIKGKKTGTY